MPAWQAIERLVPSHQCRTSPESGKSSAKKVFRRLANKVLNPRSLYTLSCTSHTAHPKISELAFETHQCAAGLDVK